jgi:hypothetical protein
MTHDELLQKMADIAHTKDAHEARNDYLLALRAVVELHKPYTPEFGGGFDYCWACDGAYPCPTIQAIEKELK